MVQQDLVENISLDLVGSRASRDFFEANAPRQIGLTPDEAPSRFDGKVSRLELLLKPDLGQHVDRGSDHRLTNVMAGETLLLQDQHSPTHFRQEPPDGCPRRPPTDHDYIKIHSTFLGRATILSTID
jgi:hypothetical protein